MSSRAKKLLSLALSLKPKPTSTTCIQEEGLSKKSTTTRIQEGGVTSVKSCIKEKGK